MNKLVFVFLPLTFLITTPQLPAQNAITPEKRKEIERMIELTGEKRGMDRQKAEMFATLRARSPEIPEETWVRIEKKLTLEFLVDQVVPVYDKHLSLEDLRAANAFFETEAGQHFLVTRPKIVQEATAIGREYGRRVGEEVRKQLQQKQAD